MRLRGLDLRVPSHVFWLRVDLHREVQEMGFPKRLTDKAHRGRVELPRPEPDVLDLVPPTPDAVYLERLIGPGA